MPTKTIIDCDPGVDDSLALCLAFSARDQLDVQGVTVVMGNNNDLDLLAYNACGLIEMCGYGDIPVVKGAQKPLHGEWSGHVAIRIHGENGVGGAKFRNPPSLRNLNHNYSSAAHYIVSACSAAPGEIQLITLGPLTNIASALLLCPQLPSLIKRIVMMGGSVGFKGNKTPCAEANIGNDPDAARIVFESGIPIVMAGLNLTHGILSSSAFLSSLGEGPVGSFLVEAMTHYTSFLTSWGYSEIPIHDSTAVMAAIHPELFVSKRAFVAVETKGEFTRGQTIADWKGQWKREPQVDVLTEVDADAFRATYLRRIRALEAEVATTVRSD
eukprot:GILI01001879.1.p1 GENE.GILI01001879.1~~GILI01001879.1.p1  ORF type:complete len:327 (-),score=89.82 GILI01001879.1:350-1330(-)